MAVDVFGNSKPGRLEIGYCNIVIGENDPNYTAFLSNCERFFRNNGRIPEADKFLKVYNSITPKYAGRSIESDGIVE